jgi:serine O-acetyltransferase
MLSLVSQMLDRLSRLEEQAHTQKYTPLHRTFLQKTVPIKDEQVYSQLRQVIDPEVG